MSAISLQRSRVTTRTKKQDIAVSNFGFGLFISGILFLGLIGGLIINTSLSHGQFLISQLRAELITAADLSESLSQEVARLESPELLKERAIQMGMVPGPGAGFIDLRDGRIIAPGLDDKYREADLSRVGNND
ncbi:MAG: hypothetical protein RL677_1018 [Actinomycetota bacterium]|jgi:hypothetical protein